jgi:hypothetical protein
MFKSARQRKLALQSPTHTTGEDSPGSAGSSLGRMLRPTNELKMRCTELDEHGNVTLVSGEFKKSELIAKYGLLPRDLRKIDSSLLPHILVRPSAILINLLNLRVLLKHNRVLVFDAYGTTDSKSQSVFMYDLDLKLRQKESPANGTLAYEFRALEAVLISVTLSLEKEFEGVSEPVVRVLRELEEDIDRDKLRYLLIYSKKLGSFEQKARLVRNALEELLEADDDLSAMYLTEKAEGKTREDEDHTEVEMLLESYHKVSDEIVQAAENLVSSIRNTEEMYVPTSHIPPSSPTPSLILSNRTLTHPPQRQSHPRRQPQLPHAARPQILHPHPRHNSRHFRRRPLRHESQKLHRGIRPRLLGRQRLVHNLRLHRRRLRTPEAAQSAARQHVRPRARQHREQELGDAAD